MRARVARGLRLSLRVGSIIRDAADVAPVLLAHLREVLATPHLEYAEPPDSIAIGAETWIFGLEFRGAARDSLYALLVRVATPEREP